ncbi:MAG TPA: flagellar hook-associated protein FlgK [Verrucomicrobiae bacterium]
MLGLFGSLNLGARSLQTQQQGVEVSGHNLANVNTPGYARQRLQISTGMALPTAVGWQGTGALGTAVTQARDAILDRQALREGAIQGSLDSQMKALQFAETYLGEKLDRQASGADGTSSTTSVGAQHGLSEGINSLFAAFQSLSTQPSSLTERQVLLMKATDLTTRFNTTSTRLGELDASLNESLTTEVGSANGLLRDLAALNDRINRAEMSDGTPANDLRDLRQQKLEALAKYVPMDVVETTGGLEISVDGQTLVSGVNQLDSLETYDAGGGRLQVRTVTGATALNLTSGSLAGTIEVRDGAIAQLRNSLNVAAGELISMVNTAHRNGFSLNDTTGADFFTGTNAGNIAVNAALTADPVLLQASGALGNKGDNQTILAMAQLNTSARAALGQQTVFQYFSKTIAAAGQALSSVTAQQSDQKVVVDMLNRQRDSVSGVSLDEEMTDMMKYQKAYTASAKLITTIDEMLDTIIGMKR